MKFTVMARKLWVQEGRDKTVAVIWCRNTPRAQLRYTDDGRRIEPESGYSTLIHKAVPANVPVEQQLKIFYQECEREWKKAKQ